MALSDIPLYNFYRRYLWTADDFEGWQTGMVDYTRAQFEGTFGGAILTGGAVAPSGLGVSVNPFIATGPSGNLLVIDSVNTVSLAAPSANSRRDYIVARPLLVNANYITKPTDPNVTVPLNTLQKAEIVLIEGTAASAPEYPATGANDVILCGVRTEASQVAISLVDIDLEPRSIVGKNSSIQQNAGKYDDRLRPYKYTNQIVAVKPSQLFSPQARAFSFVNKQNPSIFPKDLSGNFVQADTYLNFQTGAITGGDAVSADFTPTIPTTGNAIVAYIGIKGDDTLTVAYGTVGTRQQCYDGIQNQTAAGAGSVTLTANTKPIAFVIVYSSNGTTVTDLDFVDCRGGAAIGSSAVGVGGGGTTTPVSFPYSLLTSQAGITALIDTSSARTINLPSPVDGLVFTIKDKTGSAATNNITVARAGSESIEGIAASYVCAANWGCWTFICDGTNWFIMP